MQAWEESGRLMHIMRDHPAHTALVMGGMFGIYQPPRYIKSYRSIRRKLFIPIKFDDQVTLAVSILCFGVMRLNREMALKDVLHIVRACKCVLRI